MINWKNQEYITKIVTSSYCYADCLRKIDLHVSSGNYKTLKKYISEYGISIDHFDPHKNLKSNNQKRAIPLEEILVENSQYLDSYKLKKKLFEQGKFDYQCSKCGIDQWMDEEISLQLDHINGVSNDHRIENLRILCPNCHSQTSTYAGSNSKIKKPENNCVDCDAEIYKTSTRCRSCAAKKNQKENNQIIGKYPDRETLKKLVWEIPVIKLGEKFGVSGNAVKKHCDKLEIETPDRGYWQKKRAGKI